jgi:choline dehydrogenase-like flavoprotein
MPNQLHPGFLGAVLPSFGKGHRDVMRSLPKVGGAISWIDDAERGRIEVKSGRRRVHIPIHGQNGRQVRDAWRKHAQILFQAGAKEVIFADVNDTRITSPDQIEDAVASLTLAPGRVPMAAPHPGGGTRMGPSPNSSVVGMDHRVHGFDNLYVADPSVLPSPPSVDPSLTIMAFSKVAAAHIQEALG